MAKKVVVFTGMGIQMAVTIIAFVYLGRYLDGRTAEPQKTWTYVCTFTGLAIALYFLFKPLFKRT